MFGHSTNSAVFHYMLEWHGPENCSSLVCLCAFHKCAHQPASAPACVRACVYARARAPPLFFARVSAVSSCVYVSVFISLPPHPFPLPLLPSIPRSNFLCAPMQDDGYMGVMCATTLSLEKSGCFVLCGLGSKLGLCARALSLSLSLSL